MIHYLHREQIIPAPMERVWEYFCDPKNLNAITPPDMKFEIINGGDVKMYEGQLIEYRVEFIRGIRSLWLTEISHVRESEYFVDEQRVGPYRFWYHEQDLRCGKRCKHERPSHICRAIWITGRYSSYSGLKKIKSIFDFRDGKIEELFGR